MEDKAGGPGGTVAVRLGGENPQPTPAKHAGIVEIPCWVKEVSDEKALILLVLSNAQSELSPLEIGIHALKAIGLGEHGRGKEGGLSEYAQQIGKSQQYVSQVRQAAEVLKAVKTTSQLVVLLYKSQHLAAIHKAPEDTWALLVEHLLSDQWSVEETTQAHPTLKTPTRLSQLTNSTRCRGRASPGGYRGVKAKWRSRANLDRRRGDLSLLQVLLQVVCICYRFCYKLTTYTLLSLNITQ
jgi:ParB-like chromosome segregation protein Spo0J